VKIVFSVPQPYSLPSTSAPRMMAIAPPRLPNRERLAPRNWAGMSSARTSRARPTGSGKSLLGGVCSTMNALSQTKT
jgi:hypothetical protein